MLVFLLNVLSVLLKLVPRLHKSQLSLHVLVVQCSFHLLATKCITVMAGLRTLPMSKFIRRRILRRLGSNDLDSTVHDVVVSYFNCHIAIFCKKLRK
jgi:hypothetical protein